MSVSVPVDRVPVSISQFCGLLDLDPQKLIAVEVERKSSRVVLVMEPETEAEEWPKPAA